MPPAVADNDAEVAAVNVESSVSAPTWMYLWLLVRDSTFPPVVVVFLVTSTVLGALTQLFNC